MDEHLLLVVDFDNVCRLCLNSNGAFSDIFMKTECVPLHEQISRVTGLEATDGDGLPQTICHKCRYIVETAYELCERVKTSEKLLIQAVNTGADDKTKLNSDENIETLEDFDNFKEEPNYAPTNKETHKRTKVAPKNLTCQICLSPFTSEDKVKQHVQSHYICSNLTPYIHLERPFSCEKCGVKGLSSVQLVRHHREHLGVNPYLCKEPQCNFVAKDLRAYRHHATIHGSRDFVCSTCGASFKRRWGLLNHEERLHRAAQASCPKCNVKCKNEPALRAHLKTHERPRRFVCGVAGCGRAYLARGHLAAHAAAHAGLRAHRCARCPRAYTSASLLQRHVKKHHLRRRFWQDGASPAAASCQPLQFADATPLDFTVLDDASSEPPLQMVSDEVLSALAPLPAQAHVETDLHDLSSEGLLFIQVEP